MAKRRIEVEEGSGNVFADLGRQRHVSDLARYRLSRFSAERLMDFLTQLGKDVEIRITQRRVRRARSAVRVHHVA